MKSLNVNFKTTFFREGFETLRASKRLFSGVDFHVTIEFGFLREGLNALRATEGPFSRVNALVGRQVTFFGEAFLANGTFKRARTRAARFQAVALESLSAAFGTDGRFVIHDRVDVFLVFVDVIVEKTVFHEFKLASFIFRIFLQRPLLMLKLRSIVLRWSGGGG